MGRPKVHDDTTRAALLRAAETIAEREGLEAVSLRRLAAETGLTTRAVYSTFGSKDGLVDALGARAFDWLNEQLAAWPQSGDPSRDLVEATVQVFRRLAVEHTVIFQIGFHTETRDGANPLIRDAAERALQPLTRIVESIVGPGQARDAVLGFAAICEGLAALELRGNFAADRDPEETWRAVVARYVAGLR
jgi:AcrR family transcriptional regulator